LSIPSRDANSYHSHHLENSVNKGTGTIMAIKQWLKRGACALGALAALGATALALGHVAADHKMHRQVNVPIEPLALHDDAATLARGRYLFMSRGCTECHGTNGAGREFINDGHGMQVRAPNITPQAGSRASTYRVQDWVRTLRHGVKPDGTPALIMPSEDYARLTDADLGALISYLRQMPATPGEAGLMQLPWLVQTLYAAGIVQDAAEKINHKLPPEPTVPEGPTPEHGRYVANMCIGCHGPGLSGGPIPGAPPDWPAAANLTSGTASAMTRYRSGDQMEAMFKTGHRPDGTAVSQVMPFGALQALNHTDTQALYAYLSSLPARPFGQR
jgi:mono/diheme cytochrome c family protein